MNGVKSKLLLGKDFLLQKRCYLCLAKGKLDNPEGQVEVESPTCRMSFLTVFIQIKKKQFFLKRALFNATSDPQPLFLPEIGLKLLICYFILEDD